jgi:hypothetical protein
MIINSTINKTDRVVNSTIDRKYGVDGKSIEADIDIAGQRVGFKQEGEANFEYIDLPKLEFDDLTQAEKDSLKGSDANVTSENIENSTGVKIEKKAESSIIHSYGNLVNSNAAASSILNGTVSDPNILGKKVILKYFIGDGVNKTFNIGTDFTVNNVDWNNIRVLKIRDYDGANYTYLENNGFVVNNYGTNSIDIIMDSPVEENYTLEVCILSEEDDPNSNNNLITILGYDNVVNSIMSNAFGAHGVINSGEGHNTILGGSYGKIWGSFNALFGKNINIGKDDNASSFNFGIGMSNYINGGFNNVLGQNNTISGNRNSVFSTNGLIDNFDDCTLFGNRPKALGDGDFVKGAGYSLDSEPGLYQSREIFFRGETTNDIETFLMLTTGATTAEVADNSSSLVRIEVTAMLENGSKVAIYESSNILTKLAGVSKIDNLVTDVNIPMVKNIGNPNWIAELRAIVGGVRVRITGEPSGKVRWLAKLTMNQIKF